MFASAQALQLTLELMRMIIRLNLEPAFANEVEVLRDAFDNALVRSYTLWKAESTSPSEWWAAHRGIACLVTDVSRVDKILAEATAWLPVADDLEVVISTSALGEKMFKESTTHVLTARFAEASLSICHAITNSS